MTRASKLKFHPPPPPPPPLTPKRASYGPIRPILKHLELGQKKYVCFLFRPLKSLGRVGRLSALTFFIA